ncbi:hypothetical protein LCGC14_2607810, partial [marine sediment metagenome]
AEAMGRPVAPPIDELEKAVKTS